MFKISEIAEGIYRIAMRAGAAEFPPTAFVIANAATLIEPGPAVCTPQIHRALEQLGIDKLRYIIPTHIHMDHAGGTGTLAELYPEAEVPIHPRGVKHAVDPSRLIESVKMVWGDNFEEEFGAIAAVPESRIKAVEDGQIIRAGDREFQFIYTPGHAPHHMAIFDRKLKALFCGEALGMPGSRLPPAAPVSFDLDSYLSTIERLQHSGLGIRMLIYSHGGIETEPEKCMAQALENARILGDMILSSLKAGKERDDIVKEVGDYVRDRFGIDVNEQGLGTIATGYILHFEKKRMV